MRDVVLSQSTVFTPGLVVNGPMNESRAEESVVEMPSNGTPFHPRGAELLDRQLLSLSLGIQIGQQ